MGIVEDAIEFAKIAHYFQKRKYTGEPYFTHVLRVAEIVKTVPHTEEMVVAALLHDTVEDTDVTFSDIKDSFGGNVEQLVRELTDVSKPSDGNRKTRKLLDRIHLAKASTEAQTIKLADLIDNSSNILEYDKNFAKVYLEEKVLLLKVLVKGDKTLMEQAKKFLIENGYGV